MSDPLRERLIDHICRLSRPACQGGGRPGSYRCSVSMADALLPFVRNELECALDSAEVHCISCGGADTRCGAFHPEYYFTCILPEPHSGPHYDTEGGHWGTDGQLAMNFSEEQ